MSDKPFDKEIRQALERIEAEYDPSHWDRMAQRLDEEELIGTDKALDQTVRDAMEQYRDPALGHSWNALSRKLHYRDWRETYFISKVAESFILLLLFITFFHLFQPTQDSEVVADRGNGSEDLAKEHVQRGYDHTKTAEKSDMKEQKKRDALGQSPSNFSDNSVSSSIRADDSGNRTEQRDLSNREAGQTDISQTSKQGRLSSAAGQQSLHSSAVAIQQEDREQVGFDIRPTIIPPEPLVGIKTTLEYNEGTDLLVKNPVIPKPEKKSSTTWLSGFISSDLNMIQTPYDPYYDLESYSNSSPGYGIGLILEWKHDDWVMGTGFSFSQKSYHPRRITEVINNPSPQSKYRAVSLERIGFSVMSLPISMRKYFYRDGSWNVYAGGSFQLHLISQADYERLEYPVNTELDQLPQPAFFTERGQLKLDKKPSPEGILEGGSFFTSSYFSVDLMVGLEYRLRPDWILFAQPTYMHSLINRGLGPNQDRIQTLSIRFGARTTLD